jgi:hypothetical protein
VKLIREADAAKRQCDSSHCNIGEATSNTKTDRSDGMSLLSPDLTPILILFITIFFKETYFG